MDYHHLMQCWHKHYHQIIMQTTESISGRNKKDICHVFPCDLIDLDIKLLSFSITTNCGAYPGNDIHRTLTDVDKLKGRQVSSP